MLVAAGLGMAAEHALISLLALNGLRVSEATGADIQALGVERGHRTLTITRKGGEVATIPLAPRTARAIDLAIGERPEGPIFLAPGGRRLDRHGAARVRQTLKQRALDRTTPPGVRPGRYARPTPCSPSSNSSADRPRIMPRFSPGHHRHPGHPPHPRHNPGLGITPPMPMSA